jgi:hypothetical protein
VNHTAAPSPLQPSHTTCTKPISSQPYRGRSSCKPRLLPRFVFSPGYPCQNSRLPVESALQAEFRRLQHSSCAGICIGRTGRGLGNFQTFQARSCGRIVVFNRDPLWHGYQREQSCGGLQKSDFSGDHNDSGSANPTRTNKRSNRIQSFCFLPSMELHPADSSMVQKWGREQRPAPQSFESQLSILHGCGRSGMGRM